MTPMVTPRFQKQAATMSRPAWRSFARDSRAISQKATAKATLTLQPYTTELRWAVRARPNVSHS